MLVPHKICYCPRAYPEPLPEAIKIKDQMCFYNEKVDTIILDGEGPLKPETRRS